MSFLITLALNEIKKLPKFAEVKTLIEDAEPELKNLINEIDWSEVEQFLLTNVAKDEPGLETTIEKLAPLFVDLEAIAATVPGV